MHKVSAGIFLPALACASLQLAAQADDGWFNRWDSNHDGYWNWREFHNANRYYYQHHPEGPAYGYWGLHRQFHDLDHDGDGRLRPDDVRGFHNWD